jgi:hypothetical protein
MKKNKALRYFGLIDLLFIFAKKSIIEIQLLKILNISLCWEILHATCWKDVVYYPVCKSKNMLKNGKDTIILIILGSGLRLYRGVSQAKLPFYIGFFE